MFSSIRRMTSGALGSVDQLFNGEERDFGVGVFPGVAGESGFVCAAVFEELLGGPVAGGGDFGQEAAGVVAGADVDAVLAELKRERVGCALQG